MTEAVLDTPLWDSTPAGTSGSRLQFWHIALIAAFNHLMLFCRTAYALGTVIPGASTRDAVHVIFYLLSLDT